MTPATSHKSPTLNEFKQFASDIAPAARAVLMARAFAEVERERVNAYIRPIFDRYAFTYSQKTELRSRRTGLIEDPKDLYLCDDKPGLTAFFADCDDAHRAHGFTGPQGHCPALTAKNLVIQTENALINLGTDVFGIEACNLFGENRAKYLTLLIGAGIQGRSGAIMTWRDTGSGTFGNGYSTRILSVGDAHAAEELGQQFCHAWACWQSFQRRERLLAQGFAVLGGC